MYLTIHTPTSLIIGSQVNNPLLAFIFAFIAHLILDIIPHDPIELRDWNKNREVKKFLLIACIDSIILGIFLVILFLNQKLDINNYSLLVAILGGLMPDILWGLNDLTKKKIKILNKYGYFHYKILHPIIKKGYHIPWKYSLLSQVGIFVLMLWIYLKII